MERWLFFLVCFLALGLTGAEDTEEEEEVLDEYSNLQYELDEILDHSHYLENDVKNISIIASNSSLFQNVTHRGFLHGLGESISVILVSEIGDKTFFIAAILAMRNNKLVVFLGAISALFLMTILSGLLGWVFTTFIPREVTYYTCTAIMFIFGLKMLYEAWRMDENEAEEVQREVEQELAELENNVPTIDAEAQGGGARPATAGTEQVTSAPAGSSADQQQRSHEVREGAANPGFVQDTENKESTSEPATIQVTSETGNETHAPETGNERTAAPGTGNVTSPPAEAGDASASADQGSPTTQKRRAEFFDNLIDRSCKENSWFGKKCLKIFKLFINTFTMTFIAEWGDRSQLATIVLVGINDVGGVIVGGCLGHFICTGGAVLAGALIARYVSVRKVTFFGALVFLGFAIASIFISPEEDGIEGIPEINGYDNATRLINHNISLTLDLINHKDV